MDPADEPPRKKVVTEHTQHEEGAPPLNRGQGSTTVSSTSAAFNARARFLLDLEQYASDDEDEADRVVLGARPVGQFNSMPNATLPIRLSSPDPRHSFLQQAGATQVHVHRSTTAAPSDADFFFGAPPTPENNEEGHQTGGDIPASAQPVATSRVGLQLLHRMHADSHQEQSPTTASPTSKFAVVHAYAPLSTGGFLSTASVGEDALEGRTVRIGDILALRQPMSLSMPVTLISTAAASPNSEASPLPPSASASVEASSIARNALHHFRASAAFTAEEQKYGQRLSPEMAKVLLEVTRVDRQLRSVEALFLDGTRGKYAFRELRPAGYVERTVYAQWKADPATRPVVTMHSNTPSPTTASAPGTSPASPADTAAPGVLTTASDAEWWVIPHLLVRVAAESAGDWHGKKCVVKSMRRSENVIRLVEWEVEGGEVRELVGVEGLETVVPKKGGRAMVVLGPNKGEMCVVRSRVRGPDGDLSAVEVELSRTKMLLTLPAEELCALAR